MYKFKQEISKEIFFRKYALHGEKTVEEVLGGVAEEIASPEKTKELKDFWKNKFLEVMLTGEFIPGGRILANARPHSKMKNYNNCFTIDVEDSMEGIYDALKEDALIGKVGGGVGFNISALRPKGASISKGGESSGAMSFLEVFDASARAIHTGGGRRGAHICILNVDHPDIEEFIDYKEGGEHGKLTQFNISVGITDEFMRKVEEDGDWDLQFEGKVYKTIKAKELYDKMTKRAWWYNEPGALFLDTVENMNNAPHHFKVDRANPCGEIVMPPYSLCCLSSINYSKLVRNPFTEEAYFDFDRLGELVKIGVRFLDNVLDATDYPLAKIEDISKRWRRIGLGFTGLGDAFMKLRKIYGSEESVIFSDKISNFVAETAYNYSVDLAIEKGSFPGYDEGIGDYGFIKRLSDKTQKRIKEFGLRNIGLLTVAPTGTTSLTLGDNCSSGIEPVFSLQYDRTIRQDDGSTKTDTVYDDGWLEYVEFSDYKDGDELPEYIVTSHQVPIKNGIDVQAAFQYWIDHSISRTINIPFGTPLEEYKDIFHYAWEKGLKGVTSFQEGAAMEGILSTKKDEDSWKTIEVLKNSTKRPEELPCDIYEIQVNKEPVIVLVGKNPEEPYNGLPYEIFYTDNTEGLINLNRAKEGKIVKIKDGATKPSRYDLVVEGKRSKFILEDLAETFNDDYATMCRLLSLSMRHQIPTEFIVAQMNKVMRFGTFQKAIARVLKKYIPDGEMISKGSSSKCTECGGDLKFESGCFVCTSCGGSTCG